jgi:hypothetical protein
MDRRLLDPKGERRHTIGQRSGLEHLVHELVITVSLRLSHFRISLSGIFQYLSPFRQATFHIGRLGNFLCAWRKNRWGSVLA